MDTNASIRIAWEEWGNITRFLKSARIAFARECLLLDSIQLENRKKAKLTVPAGPSQYTIEFDQHMATVKDETALCAAVLVQSYALVESITEDRTRLGANGGIEAWGGQLLADRGFNWTNVTDGKAGAVEVSVVRNACAHGNKYVDKKGANRLLAAGEFIREEGSLVTINYDDLQDYRARLKSLLRYGIGSAPKEEEDSQ